MLSLVLSDIQTLYYIGQWITIGNYLQLMFMRQVHGEYLHMDAYII